MKGTPHYIQSRCLGRPGTGRSAEDVSPRSGSFARQIFQALLMAEEHDGCRREGWSHACPTRWQGIHMHCKRLFRVLGKSVALRFRARCRNFSCSHHFRRAYQNQALRMETHRAGKRLGCASWLRGPAEAVTVLRPRTRPPTPTGFPSNGGGSPLPWSLFWCSVASLSSFPAQAHGSPLLSPMRKDTRSVPSARPEAPFVRSA